MDLDAPVLTATVRLGLIERGYYTLDARGECLDPSSVVRVDVFVGVRREASVNCADGTWRYLRDGVLLEEAPYVVYGFDAAGNEARRVVPGASGLVASAGPAGVTVSGRSGAETTEVRVERTDGRVLGSRGLSSGTSGEAWTITVSEPGGDSPDAVVVVLSGGAGEGTRVELPVTR